MGALVITVALHLPNMKAGETAGANGRLDDLVGAR
jgi:hypothetical protein